MSVHIVVFLINKTTFVHSCSESIIGEKLSKRGATSARIQM
ncbi:unnamed protein product [Chondrus crispus]|uniref:Uncharacterized protein n=1 Tax=Chondrus crispus TaxID=2769 RepID=R7Q9K4_CHOCR|nr:unnamed protein product [Chondrus crispus]CDF34160.1 unnamed protein product [Chondrus crispus]|eukprot:XP_005713979.1 unnamed protein product [Chondrus crispus]